MEPDDEWENVVDVRVPEGFRLYAIEYGISNWRERFGDATRDRLSLSATGDDMSGLASVPIHALWRLECRHRKVTDDDFDLIARFDHLEELDLTSTLITDRTALRLHTLQRLRVLDLGGCKISDEALEHIAALRRLEDLDVSYTQITEDGLRALAFHPALTLLNVRGTKVTGERLAPLVTIPKLRQLGMSAKQRRRAKRFRAERPEVEILY